MRLPYANKKISEISFSTLNTKYGTKKDMMNKLQSLKGEPTLKFDQNISDYYDKLIYMRQSIAFTFEKDHVAENTQNRAVKMHEVLLIVKFLWTKPQIKNKIINNYNFYCTIILNRSDERREKSGFI